MVVLDDRNEATGPHDTCHLCRKRGPTLGRHMMQDADCERKIECVRLEGKYHSVVRLVCNVLVVRPRDVEETPGDVDAVELAKPWRECPMNGSGPTADVEGARVRQVAETLLGKPKEGTRLGLGENARILPREGNRAIELSLVRRGVRVEVVGHAPARVTFAALFADPLASGTPLN